VKKAVDSSSDGHALEVRLIEGEDIDPPFLPANFDFHLKPATEQRASVLDAQQRLAGLGAAG